ncbi:hypothetical protein CDIK_1228 [Cucumispora dikerogammari]|nr:hypothetical protein CDIK_1228 [Cucumispora dikerogammari]
MHFGNDVAGIKSYLVSRFSSSEINDIVTFNRSEILPIVYSQLLNAQITLIAVERSFSMQKKLMALDRNFNKQNISKYIVAYFNIKSTAGASFVDKESSE